MSDIGFSELKQLQERLNELLAGVMSANNAVTMYIRDAGNDFSRIEEYSADVRKALQRLNGFIIRLRDRDLDLVVRPRNPFAVSAHDSYQQARGILAPTDEAAEVAIARLRDNT